MSQKRENRIKLLQEVREIVERTVETDREVFTTEVRRENSKLKRMIKEIEEWEADLEQMRKLVKAQHRLAKEKIKEIGYVNGQH